MADREFLKAGPEHAKARRESIHEESTGRSGHCWAKFNFKVQNELSLTLIKKMQTGGSV